VDMELGIGDAFDWSACFIKEPNPHHIACGAVFESTSFTDAGLHLTFDFGHRFRNSGAELIGDTGVTGDVCEGNGLWNRVGEIVSDTSVGDGFCGEGFVFEGVEVIAETLEVGVIDGAFEAKKFSAFAVPECGFFLAS